ncbi:MAG: nitronate monooxygenase [Alphaproteobacteria bacterium]|nr:nitronate monooxygenase [Alphaproteobacteria bacterium]
MQQAQHYLHNLWQKGCDFLGVKHAILGGAMTWVSERNLVAAISNAGGFGVLACGAMPPEILAREIKETLKLTDKPFGVNLITLHPKLEELVQTCIQEKVTHVVLAGGVPSKNTITTLKDAGIKVICFAPALALAKRMVNFGADALVIEGNEAGGHIGPVSTSVLAQEILPHITDVPIFIAGGIGRGESMVSYLEMGASGCQLGTRFVCAHECQAHPNFKKAFIKSASRNAIVSSQIDPRFPVIPVRAIDNKGTQDFMVFQREMINKVDQGDIALEAAQLEIEHYWAGSLRKAVVEGDIDHGSLMAGQSVGLVKTEQSTQEIIDELIAQAVNALNARVQKAS